MESLITMTNGVRFITAPAAPAKRWLSRLTVWVGYPADDRTRNIWRNRQVMQCNDTFWEAA